MTSYAMLDAVADSYNPLLAIFSVSYVLISAINRQWRSFLSRVLGFFSVLVVAYGLMFADKRYQIWEGLGLDYSTHTATSLGMVLFLSYCDSRFSIYFIASFITYSILMLHQQYHSSLDILTTGITVALLVGGILVVLHKSKREPIHG